MAADPREIAALRVARALADPTRFRLLRAIGSRDELSCRELTALFPIAQATVSHHLKVLSEAGLVLVRVEGPSHFYRAVPGALAAHGRALEAIVRSTSNRSPSRSRKELSP
jgi:ArsR family transcriptional regulator